MIPALFELPNGAFIDPTQVTSVKPIERDDSTPNVVVALGTTYTVIYPEDGTAIELSRALGRAINEARRKTYAAATGEAIVTRLRATRRGYKESDNDAATVNAYIRGARAALGAAIEIVLQETGTEDAQQGT